MFDAGLPPTPAVYDMLTASVGQLGLASQKELVVVSLM